MNERDFVLRRIRGDRARARVIVSLVAGEAAEPGALTARFDIVLEAEPDYFYSSTGVASVAEVLRSTKNAPYVGGVLSYHTPLAEVARQLGENPRLSELPERAVSDLASLAEMAG